MFEFITRFFKAIGLTFVVMSVLVLLFLVLGFVADCFLR